MPLSVPKHRFREPRAALPHYREGAAVVNSTIHTPILAVDATFAARRDLTLPPRVLRPHIDRPPRSDEDSPIVEAAWPPPRLNDIRATSTVDGLFAIFSRGAGKDENARGTRTEAQRLPEPHLADTVAIDRIWGRLE